MIKTIICPHCDYENEYDDDNDVILCWDCDEMIYIPEEESNGEDETRSKTEDQENQA